MSELKKCPILLRRLSIIGSLSSATQNWRKGRATPCYRQMKVIQACSSLLPYPIDMYPLLALPLDTLDEAKIPNNTVSSTSRVINHPMRIAQYALAHWNAYLASGRDEHKEIFMKHTSWLLTHEVSLSDKASGWPIPLALPAYHAPQPYLSAMTQGNVISVFVRAYQLTSDKAFLQAAYRAVRTFELDILDSGVSTPVGNNGVFFETVAVYPAAHILYGYILALFGLYDYVMVTKDKGVEELIQRSITTFHTLIDEYDTGYWTCYDLLHKRLASQFYHSLHVTLLEALSRYSGCKHCAVLAQQWAGYQRRLGCRLNYLIVSRITDYYDDKLKPKLRYLTFRVTGTNSQSIPNRVCIPITDFPVSGGVRGVLAGVSQVMEDKWQMVYLTRNKGKGEDELEIEVFGGKVASPWYFPSIWLYCMAGLGKLFNLLRSDSGYRLILPQDGVFTGAFAALAGKMAGVRVVCMDHGNVTWLHNLSFRLERLKALEIYPWYKQILFRLLLDCYCASLRLLAQLATRCTDQFLIVGDEVEDVYRKQLNVHPSRIIRYAYMIDVARFTPPDRESRMRMRTEQGIPEEAIVITLINRLAPEKGLHFALEGIALALSELPLDLGRRVRVLIAGDGPLRLQVEADIRRRALDSVCILWGEANPSQVITLLGISDIFLYCGTRGTNYSMAVLEAMAAGCAVVASVVPQSNARLLAEGRGVAIASGSAVEIGTTLARLCSDLVLCRQMGRTAREYVANYHTDLMLKRSLLRASFFAPPIVVKDADE